MRKHASRLDRSASTWFLSLAPLALAKHKRWGRLVSRRLARAQPVGHPPAARPRSLALADSQQSNELRTLPLGIFNGLTSLATLQFVRMHIFAHL